MSRNMGGNSDDLVSHVTSAMEVIRIPDDPPAFGSSASVLLQEPSLDVSSMMSEPITSISSQNTAPMTNVTATGRQPQLTPLIVPDPTQRRPLDDIIEAGSPADPIPFARPKFERGRRDDVLCYNSRTKSHDVARNVLFRDFSREFGDSDGELNRVQQCYWPLPQKEKIKTIMGHVEICLILTRCIREQDDSSRDSNEHSDDSSAEEEEEEDIVFQITNKFVAVKVNYCDRMDRLRDKHAEDPLKEIAAMQLIGNYHPNVMGAIEVLFDGANLNVVMPYCGSGDLFEMLQDSQQSTTPGMPEGEARYWFRQVIAGVQYLHSIGLCHRDLSPENVMIDGKGCLIIDMGMCIRIPYTNPNFDPSNYGMDSTTPENGNNGNNHGSPHHQVTDISHGTRRRMIRAQGACGKLPYMSPEIYRNRSAFDGGAVDIWTAGTILFCMVTGNRSYQRPHSSDPQFYWMTHGLPRLLSDWGVTISKECLHLLEGMLRVDPRLRLTLDEVLRHPWFALPDQLPARVHAQGGRRSRR